MLGFYFHNMFTSSRADSAVSPVIATILIIALTVLLAGIASAVFMGFASVPSAAPVVGISIEMEPEFDS